LKFQVQGSGLRVWGSGFSDPESRVCNSELGVDGRGLRVADSGCRVEVGFKGLGFKV